MSDFVPPIVPLQGDPAARERILTTPITPPEPAGWPAEGDIDAAITAQSACEALERDAGARGRGDLARLAGDAASAAGELVRALAQAYDEGTPP
jgi:hypothetical protein